ncbi:MAG: hypothetical protein R3A47_10795 [Polyangiales bacterium]
MMRSAPRKTQLTLRVNSERVRVLIAHAMAAMLHEVGVEVRVQPSESATLISDLNRGRFEMVLLEVPEVIEPHVLSWSFASHRIPSAESDGANCWRYRNPELDKLF